MTTVTLTIEDDLFYLAKAKCEEQGGRSLSSLIREALSEKIEKSDPEKTEEGAN